MINSDNGKRNRNVWIIVLGASHNMYVNELLDIGLHSPSLRGTLHVSVLNIGLFWPLT